MSPTAAPSLAPRLGARASTSLLAVLVVLGVSSLPAAAQEAPDSEPGARSEQAPARPTPPRRPGAGRAELTLDAGAIRIAFAPLDREKDARDLAALEALAPGGMFAFDGGRAIKLTTAPSLRFGETTVPTGNAAPGYPGVYSLWLERTGDGWALVFNEHADIWGSQREAAADVARAPLAHATTDADQPVLQVTLDGAGDSGTLTIAWGAHRWTAGFTAIP
jgi:hypothetical protein